MDAEKQKDSTPSLENIKKTQSHTYDEKNPVGGEGGGVGATHEAWGGELSRLDEENEEQAETD